MADFTPTLMERDGVGRRVSTWRDYYDALWEGFHAVGAAPEPPAFSERERAELSATYATVAAVGALADEPTGGDDSAAIRGLFVFATRVTLRPGRTYRVSRDGVNPYTLGLPAGSRLIGQGATIKLADAQAAGVSLLRPLGNDVWVSGVTLDGNRANQSVEATAQRHGIYADQVTGFRITDSTIREMAGDGVLLYRATDDAVVAGCTIKGTSRAGIALVGNMARPRIISNVVTGVTTQPFDGEPEVDGGITDAKISGNYFAATGNEYALTTSGRPTSRNARWSITNNTLIGRVNVLRINDVKLTGNHIDGSAVTTTSVIQGEYGSDRVEVSGNTVIASGSVQAIRATLTSGEAMTRWRVLDNTITAGTGRAINLEGVASGEVSRNAVVGSGAGFSGIRVQATGNVDSMAIDGNHVEGYTNAVYLETFSTFTFGSLRVVGNRSRSVTNGVNLAGTAAQYAATPVVYDNPTTGIGLVSTTPWVRTGGALRGVFEGTGTPEGVLTASVGAFAVRRDGGAGTTFYIKESGTAATGWVGK